MVLHNMAVSLKQLLVSILFVGFAMAAMLNHERPYMLEFVKLATFGTLVAMAYGIWATSANRGRTAPVSSLGWTILLAARCVRRPACRPGYGDAAPPIGHAIGPRGASGGRCSKKRANS